MTSDVVCLPASTFDAVKPTEPTCNSYDEGGGRKGRRVKFNDSKEEENCVDACLSGRLFDTVELEGSSSNGCISYLSMFKSGRK